EVEERASRHAYPVSELEPAEVREALGNLKTLDRDEWASAWSAIGDRHMAKAKGASGATAGKEYKYAFEYYLFARFPLENSPGKVKAYDKALEAFTAYAKLQDPPIEIVRIPFEGKEIVGYLRLPKGVRPAPLVLTIGGLDARKENASFRSDEYLFELFEARAAIYGAKTLAEFLAYGPKMSLKTAGWLDKPSAPMLVINGMRDTQVPVEDLFLLMRSGSPKEVWINPQGGHMGRNKEISDQKIFETVTLPWVVRMVNSNPK